MKIMRYCEIKALGPVIPVNNGRYQLNPSFNLANCQGEIIILLGSRVSSQTWLDKLFREKQNSGKQAMAGSFARPYVLSEADNSFQTLSPVKSLAEQILRGVKANKAYLTTPQKLALTEQYITAAGLQAFRDLTPLQVPGAVVQQAKLALRFAAGQEVVLLDNLFDSLEPQEKALLHISLVNLQDSEVKRRTLIYSTQNLDDAIYMADRILIMNPVKVGTVAENLPVNLERPRNRHHFKSNKAYHALRRQLHYLLTDALALEDYLLLW